MQTLKFVILLIIVSIIIICIFGPEFFPFYNLYSMHDIMYEKQQWVRLVDMFVFGPASIYIGYKLETDVESWGYLPYLLYAYGYGTIVFNFLNYYKNFYS